jgi:hypothetical protein
MAVGFAMVVRKVQNQGGGCDAEVSYGEPANTRENTGCKAEQNSTNLTRRPITVML